MKNIRGLLLILNDDLALKWYDVLIDNGHRCSYLIPPNEEINNSWIPAKAKLVKEDLEIYLTSSAKSNFDSAVSNHKSFHTLLIEYVIVEPEKQEESYNQLIDSVCRNLLKNGARVWDSQNSSIL